MKGHLFCARIALGAAVLASANFAHGNPKGGTVSQGSASFNTSGSHLTINTSDRAFINWQSFNIAVGETTTFVQPASTSLVWNQINDPNPSQILGTLNANGYVVLQNSAGFYVGGQASITTHGLMLTTAPVPALDLAGSGPWEFSAPPPTAKIINYGQINVGQNGSAFIIAHDIENNGTIMAPGGDIGLYAGKQVLVSTRPDGRGLSATVTLPEGSVDNSGKLIADGGTIALHAQVVNQGGLIQANSAINVNGTIQLLASDAINLGANSVISAQGDSQGASSGGSVTIKSGNTFSDQSGSAISIAGGANGGDGGSLEISAANLSGIQSHIDGHAASGFHGGTFTIDPTDLNLTSAFVSTLTPTLNSGLYQINLQADHNITLSTLWNLADPGGDALLSLTAGNDIIFNANSGIQAGNNWSVSLTAGPLDLAAKPTTARTDGIYLDGNSFIQTQNGDINLWSANEVLVSSGAIRTRQGGSINVFTKFGDVNSGINGNGFVFNRTGTPYTVSPTLGGISTAAGGDVTINAGGNVISYLPSQVDFDANRSRSDAGTGAFGSQPGNVSITAGGKVSGHYVVANGVGTITAMGGNVGAPLQQSGGFALSLIKGSWDVNAPNGSIYLQEVRNPNGIFNTGGPGGGTVALPNWHYFDYDPDASVSLTAANSVQIIGGGPRDLKNAAIPILLPPSLSVVAGSGGFVLGANVILFPSANQNLDITTLAGGNFEGNNFFLEMSDSSKHQWSSSSDFGVSDHAATPLGLNNPNPVEISISGSMNNADLFTTKVTHIFVGGDMNNSSFLGENLHASDATSINVLGKIYNAPSLNFVGLPGSITPAYGDAWDSIFTVAVDPSVASLNISQFTTSEAIKEALRTLNYLIFPGNSPSGLGNNPGFVYDASTLRLGFNGSLAALTAKQISALKSGVFTVLVLDTQGNPIIDPNDPSHSHLLTKTYTFLSPTDPSNSGKDSSSLIASLYTESLSVPKAAYGYQIGGPGTFNISAASLDLGNSAGIMSWGIGTATGINFNYSSLAGITPTGAGINVNVTGDINMLTSRIASIYGGDVSVVSTGGGVDLGSQNLFITSTTQIAYGIYTAGHSDVSVIAHDNVSINGSRIAAYDGGNVFVKSLFGNVSVGSGGNTYVSVPIVRSGQNPTTDPIYGSGILALSLPKEFQTPGVTLPGDITVLTPQGDILADKAGILQLALDGNVAGGPTITLTAGTKAVTDDHGNVITPAIPGNIDLGDSGLIGGTVNVTAEGNIKGFIISRQGSDVHAAQNFTGTVLAGGNATVGAGGTVAGVIVGIGGATVLGTVTAEVLGQNVSVNGGASTSTLGTTATATAASQSAANEATTEAEKQVANDDSQDDDKKKKGLAPVLARRFGRVTIVLPKAI